MNGDIGMSLAPGPQPFGMPPSERTTFNGINMATDALARATGSMSQMPPVAPHIVDPSFVGPDLGQQPLGRVQIDPRLGAFEDAYFAKPAMMQSSSFLQRFPSRLDTDISMDRNIVTSPGQYPTPHQSLASLNAPAPNRRPSLAHTSTGTSLPPVRDLIEVAHQGNEAQANLSRRTSSYSSMGGADMTPSRRQSVNGIPQSPMHFGNVVYSSNTSGHHRQDSWPGLGPFDPGSIANSQSYNHNYNPSYTSNFNSTFNSSYNSAYNPRRVPPRKVPPFPSMLGSTVSSGANSSNSVPSLGSIPSLTSAASFETSAATPMPGPDVSPDAPADSATATAGTAVQQSLHSAASGSGGGGYKCTVPDCKATPFTTQYLLTYVFLPSHSSATSLLRFDLLFHSSLPLFFQHSTTQPPPPPLTSPTQLPHERALLLPPAPLPHPRLRARAWRQRLQAQKRNETTRTRAQLARVCVSVLSGPGTSISEAG